MSKLYTLTLSSEQLDTLTNALNDSLEHAPITVTEKSEFQSLLRVIEGYKARGV